MKTIILVISSCLLSASLWADQTWRCQNMVAKEVCDNKSCVEQKTSDDAFDITLNPKQGVSICNRMNCWRGSAQKTKVNDTEAYQVTNFTWKTIDQAGQGYTLMIQPTRNSLYLQSDQRRYALHCRNV